MSLRTLVGEYCTRTGQVGVKIYRHEGSDRSRELYGFPATYSYNGKWGAGSGHSLGAMQKFLGTMLDRRQGVKVVVPFNEVSLPPGTTRG